MRVLFLGDIVGKRARVYSYEKIKEYNNLISTTDFWKDKFSAQKVLKEKKFFENITSNFKLNVNELENLQELVNLALRENETQVINDCEKKTEKIIKKINIIILI